MMGQEIIGVKEVMELRLAQDNDWLIVEISRCKNDDRNSAKLDDHM